MKTLIVLTGFLLVSCAGKEPRPVASGSEKSLPQKRNPTTVPDEMVGVLPHPLGQPNAEKAPAPLPDKAALTLMAKDAIAQKRQSDALPILDILILTYPQDAEFWEMRGELLIAQGMKEDGAADLKNCCKLGRATCCP